MQNKIDGSIFVTTVVVTMYFGMTNILYSFTTEIINIV